MKKSILKLMAMVLLLATLILTLGSCSYDVYVVEIKVKDYGTITVELDATSAPATVANFISLVKADFYDGLTFHRVKENFMIQGGCPKGDGTGDGPNTIPGEFSANKFYSNNISHVRGVISMARGNDMNSASCQFFITNADARASLDGSYAAFGYVIDGMDVVDAITKKTGPLGDPKSYTIADKSKQAVIEDIVIVKQYNID